MSANPTVMQSGERLALVVAGLSFAASAALRALYLAEPWRIDRATFPMFLGDEGVYGLMGLHILRGGRPVFYYGSYYLGAFDAYVTAVLFAVFGSSLASLRALPGILALLTVPAAYAVAQRLYGPRAGWLAASLAALPSPFVFEWGTLAICGYAGYVLVVLLLLYFFLAVAERVTAARLAALGFLGGFSFWNNGLLIPYVGVIAAALWVWVPLRRRDVAILLAAGAVGMAPLVYGNITTPLTTARQIARKAVFAWTLGKQQMQSDEDDDGDLQYASHPLLEVLGAQPARDGRWSAAGSAGALVLLAGAAAALARCRRRRDWRSPDFRNHAVLLAMVAAAIVLGAGGWAGQPVGRYQLPLYVLLAIASAGWLARSLPRLAVPAVALVALVHAGLIARPAEAKEGTTSDGVQQALGALGLTRGYSAGPMYDVVFRSREKLILVPLDHSRYLAYEPVVDRDSDIFYLYRTNQKGKPAHRAFLRLLSQAAVEHQRMDFGDFHVLYGFAPRERISAAAIAQVREDFRREKFGG